MLETQIPGAGAVAQFVGRMLSMQEALRSLPGNT